ncbi:MAG TPA: ATP-binding protein [Acidimicrobiales bacterium]
MTDRPSSLLDSLPDGVVVLDRERTIIALNAEGARLCDASADELIGAKLEDAVDPRLLDGRRLLDGAWHPSAHLRCTRGTPEMTVLLRRRDGSDRRVLVTGRYQRDAEGALDGMTLALRDAGRRSAQRAEGIEIVSTVSHELRSPLTSVKGYTSLLLSRWDRLDDEQKKMMLEQVHHDADRVTRLVTELLDISRIETGRLVLRREMIDLSALATSVVEKVAMGYPDLQCAVGLPHDLPVVYADPHKVEQVLTNLVENAAKYGSVHGMAITGATADSAVTISVVDHGEGIPEHDLKRVFTKFFRRDIGRPTGSGLGLWISQGLVEAHGGELTATSKLGEGSTFSFSLPTGAFEALHPTD